MTPEWNRLAPGLAYASGLMFTGIASVAAVLWLPLGPLIVLITMLAATGMVTVAAVAAQAARAGTARVLRRSIRKQERLACTADTPCDACAGPNRPEEPFMFYRV